MRIIRKVPVHGFPQIEEYSGIRFGESVTLNTATFGSRQFHMNIIVFQPDLIISGTRRFFGMGKQGMNAQRSLRFFIR